MVGKAAFTLVCHCKGCQTIGGSGFSSTNLMTYDSKGAQFTGVEEVKVSHVESDAGNKTRR